MGLARMEIGIKKWPTGESERGTSASTLNLWRSCTKSAEEPLLDADLHLETVILNIVCSVDWFLHHEGISEACALPRNTYWGAMVTSQFQAFGAIG